MTLSMFLDLNAYDHVSDIYMVFDNIYGLSLKIAL